MRSVLGDRNICLARELTKRYEEFIRGTISEVLEIIDTCKGEMVLVVEGKKLEDEAINDPDILMQKLRIISKPVSAVRKRSKKLPRNTDVLKMNYIGNIMNNHNCVERQRNFL